LWEKNLNNYASGKLGGVLLSDGGRPMDVPTGRMFYYGERRNNMVNYKLLWYNIKIIIIPLTIGIWRL
jgi:hypothetical protein